MADHDDRASTSARPTERFGLQPLVAGQARVRRSRAGGLPFELASGDRVLARMGRPGWFKIYFGRGQPIEVGIAGRWRLRAVGRASYICPVVVDEAGGGKLALSGLGDGNYGINGRTWAFVMNPADPAPRGRSDLWSLREHETTVAVVSRKELSVTCREPIPVSAVFLAFTLARYGIPGENELRLPFRWN